MTADLSFTVPLTDRDRRTAERYRRLHPQPHKATRIYRQVLALYAVQFYCQCMGVATRFSQSGSWDVVQQVLGDCAPLELPGLGTLECCPTTEVETDDADSPDLHNLDVEVSPEAFGDRLGYVAVRFSPSYDEAEIVGFRTQVARERTPLSDWHALDRLLDCFAAVAPAERVVSREALPKRAAVPPWVRLDRWLQGQFETDWTAIGDRRELAIAFRKPPSERSIERVKRLEFSDGRAIDLQVGVYLISSQEIDVRVRVVPEADWPHLTDTLRIAVLDASGHTVMEAETRDSQTVRLEFSVEPQEQFQLRLEREGVASIERFTL